jgi:hypothetical protein
MNPKMKKNDEGVWFEVSDTPLARTFLIMSSYLLVVALTPLQFNLMIFFVLLGAFMAIDCLDADFQQRMGKRC